MSGSGAQHLLRSLDPSLAASQSVEGPCAVWKFDPQGC